ncbi:MAG: YceD family protein [Rhodobacteraceae bacterium]|nr:YceD family protein [Paracoccaceae bacterium]
MSDPIPYSHPFRRTALAQRKPTRFDLTPDAAQRAAIAADLGLLDLHSVRLRGEIRPVGRSDFVLEADLEAEIVQACIVTLAPVPGRVSEKIVRRYLADWQVPEGEEAEMPEDDTIEPLPEIIDAGTVLTEALTLALPLYPRAEGANFEGFVKGAEGVTPLTDEKMKPFSGLADLLKKKPE